MGRRTTAGMPNRKKIFEYWKDKREHVYNDNTCFKCGRTSTIPSDTYVERAHIHPAWDGGSDDVSNIHLLCSPCHKDSEDYFDDVYDLWINDFHGEGGFEFHKKLAANHYFGKIKKARHFEELFRDLDFINEQMVQAFGKDKLEEIHNRHL